MFRYHQLVVNRKMNYNFSLAREFNNLVKLAGAQRFDGWVVISVSYQWDAAGSNPVVVAFFDIQRILKFPKRDDAFSCIKDWRPKFPLITINLPKIHNRMVSEFIWIEFQKKLSFSHFCPKWSSLHWPQLFMPSISGPTLHLVLLKNVQRLILEYF